MTTSAHTSTLKTLNIATRQSPLAMWQAEYIKSRLESLYPELEVNLVTMVTKGDKILDTPLAKIGGKGLFVKELEQALYDGRADIAVHSLKDVPMELPEGLILGTYCKREAPTDAFVSNDYDKLEDLPQGAVVGTASLRRQCQIKAFRPDLQIKSLRGNVQTRLAKLDAGEYDAIILATSGLKRVGLRERIKQEIDNLFNNKLTPTIERLQQLENEASEALKFEQAGIYRDYIKALKLINFDQIVEVQKSVNIDIIGFYENNGMVCILIFCFIKGKLLAKHEFISEYIGDIYETILSYLVQYYESTVPPKEVYINLPQECINLLQTKFAFKVFQPIKGKYMDLITSAINNAKEYLEKNKLKFIDAYNRTLGAHEELRNLLGLRTMSQIDIIDNSNIFLEDPVSGVVVFKDGRPCKHLYRKYNLRTTIKKSDYYFMQEVIIRRYTKIEELPDVLIVDGGLLQVQAAQEILQQLELVKPITVIGLQKNDKHQTEGLILPDRSFHPLDKQSYLYRFLAFMQDEVHRFAITFYRNKSSKSKLNQFLDGIDGLGLKSKQKIMRIYPNIYDLKYVDQSTIEQIIPKKAAKNLMIKIQKELK